MVTAQASPGRFAVLPSADDRGTPIFSVLVKRTYNIVPGQAAVRAETDEPLVPTDLQPLPQGFGWFPKTAYPRCSFVGAMPGDVNLDEPLREEGLGLVPPQQIALARQFRLPRYDIRFQSGASLGLAVPFLAGHEHVMLIHLTPEGRMEFDLPKETPRIMLDISLGENELRPVAHTICIRPEQKQVDRVWRAAHEYPGTDWLPEMKGWRLEVS